LVLVRTISATVDIAAPPDQVWDVLADLDGYPDWNPFSRTEGDFRALNRALKQRAEHGAGR
jgi:uncharacterized protein YndB with AHSA1/START domain